MKKQSWIYEYFQINPKLLLGFRNVSWLTIDQFFRVVLGVCVGTWVARFLGPEQFGNLSFAILYISIFSVFCKLGIDAIAIREIATDKNVAAKILGTTFYLRLIVSPFAYFVAILGMFVFESSSENSNILIAILGIAMFFQTADTVEIWFQSQVRSSFTAKAKVTSYLVGALIKIGLILCGASILTFAVASLVESMVAALGMWYVYRSYPSPSKWFWDKATANALVTESWPYLLSGLAICVYLRIDQVVILELIGSRAVGIYSAALTLSTPLYFIPSVLIATIAPSMARLKKEDPAGFVVKFRAINSVMWWLTIPTCVLVSLSSGFLVQTLYGKAFAEASSVLAIHVFTLIPVALGVVQSCWIVNEKKGGFALKTTILGAVSSLIANILLVPCFGTQGAAISAIFAFSFSSIFSNLIFAPRLFLMQFQSLINPILHIRSWLRDLLSLNFSAMK